jgi:hypothetical protein
MFVIQSPFGLWYMIPSNRMTTFIRCFAVITYGLHNIGLTNLSSIIYLYGTEFNFMLCEMEHTKLKSVFKGFKSFILWK